MRSHRRVGRQLHRPDFRLDSLAFQLAHPSPKLGILFFEALKFRLLLHEFLVLVLRSLFPVLRFRLLGFSTPEKNRRQDAGGRLEFGRLGKA